MEDGIMDPITRDVTSNEYIVFIHTGHKREKLPGRGYSLVEVG